MFPARAGTGTTDGLNEGAVNENPEGPVDQGAVWQRTRQTQALGDVLTLDQSERHASVARIIVLLTLTAFMSGTAAGALLLQHHRPELAAAASPAAEPARRADVKARLAQPVVEVALGEPPSAGTPAIDAYLPLARGGYEPPAPAYARHGMAAARDAADRREVASTRPPASIGPTRIGLTAGRSGTDKPVHDAWAALPRSASPRVTPPAPEPPERHAEQVMVKRGDTLMTILTRAGIGRAEAHEAVATLEDHYDPRRLKAGQFLALEFERSRSDTADLRLAGLAINLDFENEIRVDRAPTGGFEVRTVERELGRETRVAAATIEDSLYLSARRENVPDETLLELIKLFSWDVDFQRDIHQGDAFEVVYDIVTTADGKEARAGEILFASLNVRGERLNAYRYERPDGSAGYYDEEGRSVRKWLMRTPIDGARLSSGFGMRKHPILGYSKMHKGVDFAAPPGTPVYAAGDGVVAQAGRNGGYGNYIRLRHNAEYSTAYAHLQGFAEGVRANERVKQGEVIGYVGSTGRSTGPHLHYEVLENGSQINPLEVKQQVADRLEGRDLARFKRQIETVQAHLDGHRPTRLARNER